MFEMKTSILRYDIDKSILLCMSNNKKLWAKKLMSVGCLSNIIEDDDKYYIACESGELNGQLLALRKVNGSTAWFIPGKSFLQIIFERYLYLIFVDGDEHHYLLKVNRRNGKVRWHHYVNHDLCEYRFTLNMIQLSYASGRSESLSLKNGRQI
ncbi:MAG: hypothetical protein SVZ03_17400 [Spirochaetota bacterium]|nr:hypothetical protein [Spirochaetota bacterium]